MSYVVTGVSGNTGRVAAEALLRRGAPVRVVVRDAAKGAPWEAKGAEVAVADLGDADALRRALEGARGAYLLVPPSATEPDFRAYQDRIVASIVRAVGEARVPHVVLLSSVGAQHEDRTGPIAALHRAELALGRLGGTRLSSIRAGYFLENFGGSLPATKDGVLPSFLPADLPLPMIASRDIGALAADLLSAGPEADAVVELGTARTTRDAAKAAAAILGRPVEVAEAPLSAIVPTLTGFGLSTSLAELYREMNEGILSGRVAFEGGHRRVEGTTSIEEVFRGLLGRG